MKRVALLSCHKPLHFFETPHGSKIDPFSEDASLIQAFEKRKIAAVRVPWNAPDVNWKDFDAVCVRSTWDYFVQCDAFLETVDKIAAQTQLWNRAETLRWNSNKQYLEELAGYGLRVVPTVLVEEATPDRLKRAAESRGWKKYVAKPTVSGGALATYRLPEEEGKLGEIARAHSNEFIVQPFVPSVLTEGEWSFIFLGGQYQFAVQKKPASGDYRVQSIHGAVTQLGHPTPSDIRAAEEIIEGMEEETLYARIDMVRDDSGKLMVMECELIEPFLFFTYFPEGTHRFVEAALELTE